MLRVKSFPGLQSDLTRAGRLSTERGAIVGVEQLAAGPLRVDRRPPVAKLECRHRVESGS